MARICFQVSSARSACTLIKTFVSIVYDTTLFRALYVLSFPGHLAARGDFIYANEQRSTFNYINVAPQVSFMTILGVLFTSHIAHLSFLECCPLQPPLHCQSAAQKIQKRRMANRERGKQVLISLFVIRMGKMLSNGKEGKKRRTKTNIAKNNIQIQSHEVSGSVVTTTLYTQLT